MSFIQMLKVAGSLRLMVVAFIAWGLDKLGLAEQFPAAEHILDVGLNIVQGGALVWAAIWRIYRPNPSLTQRAADRAVAMGVTAKSVVVPPNKSDGSPKAHWLMTLLAGLIAVISMASGLSGCAGTRAAYKAADTLSDYAGVVGEQYAALLEEAATYKEQGGDAQIVSWLQRADDRAKPLVKALRPLSEAWEATHSAKDEKALQEALDKAVVAVNDFIKAIKAARGTPSAKLECEKLRPGVYLCPLMNAA